MAGSPALSVVVPVWNEWALTRDCLQSMAETAGAVGPALEVVVVDNGSADETVNALAPLGERLFGRRFQRVRSEENLGFGRGCNLGAERCSGSLLLFLNNDTVCMDGWAAPLIAAFRNAPRLGAVSPLLLYPNGRVQHMGVVFTPTLHVEHLFAHFPAAHPAVARRRTLQALSGAAFCIPAELFRSCGGFHSGYTNGSEDLDLSCQVRRHGRTLRCAPASRIVHLAEQTPRRHDHDHANAALFNQRCVGCFVPDLHRIAKREGYDMSLTEWLQPVFSAPAPALATDPRVEPLWEPGYAEWVAERQAAGDAAGLAEALFYHAYFFPALDRYDALESAANAAGRHDLARFAASRRATVRSLLGAPDLLADRARQALHWASNAGDGPLAGVFRDWLHRHGHHF